MGAVSRPYATEARVGGSEDQTRRNPCLLWLKKMGYMIIVELYSCVCGIYGLLGVRLLATVGDSEIMIDQGPVCG